MLNSFKYAFNGIKEALNSEHNLRIHFTISFLVLLLAYYLKLNNIELSLLIITIAFVIILELINTVVEKLVDMYSKEISEKARIIKDISAGFVLIGAITSVFVGLILFLPKLFGI